MMECLSSSNELGEHAFLLFAAAGRRRGTFGFFLGFLFQLHLFQHAEGQGLFGHFSFHIFRKHIATGRHEHGQTVVHLFFLVVQTIEFLPAQNLLFQRSVGDDIGGCQWLAGQGTSVISTVEPLSQGRLFKAMAVLGHDGRGHDFTSQGADKVAGRDNGRRRHGDKLKFWL